MKTAPREGLTATLHQEEFESENNRQNVTKIDEAAAEVEIADIRHAQRSNQTNTGWKRKTAQRKWRGVLHKTAPARQFSVLRATSSLNLLTFVLDIMQGYSTTRLRSQPDFFLR